MALTPCAPCTCIPGVIGREKFMQDMEIILCGILTAIENADITTENVNITGINGVVPSVNNGASDAGTLRVTLANNSTGVVTVNNGAGAAAVNIQDGGNSITVDGTVAATQSGTWNIATVTTLTTLTTLTGTTTLTPGTGATNLGKAEDAVAASGDTGVFILGVRNGTSPTTPTSGDGDYSQLSVNFAGALYNNTDIAYQQQASSGILKAEDTAHGTGDAGVFALNVSNEALSTFGADGDYTPHAVDTKGRGFVTGQVAHDAANAGNPVMVGGEARSTNLAVVANGDAVKFIGTLDGRQVSAPYAIGDNYNAAVGSTSSSGETSIQAASGATLRNVITSLTLSNTAATANTVSIKNGAGGGTVFSVTLQALTSMHFTFPFPIRLPLNTAIILNLSAATAIGWSFQGYIGTD